MAMMAGRTTISSVAIQSGSPDKKSDTAGIPPAGP
jgi:hypothetical protein